MARNKSPLRVLFEEYFKNNDEVIKDDWLSIPYKNKEELKRIKIMFYSVKNRVAEAKNAIIDVNKKDCIVWVHR